MSPSVIVGVLLGAGLAVAGAPPKKTVDRATVEAERTRCKAECASIESPTDRGTCELVCDTRAEAKLEGPEFKQWHTEKDMGGTPPEVPNGPEATREARPTSRAMASAFAARQGLAQCQARCDTVTKATHRWMCKAQCLDKHPTPRSVLGSRTGAPVAPSLGTKTTHPASRRGASTAPARTTPTTHTTTSPSSSPQRSCASECASAPAGDDRETCLTQCEYRRETSRSEVHGTRSIGSVKTPNTKACVNTCESRASACRSACTGSGSDATTCRLQCDQTASSCKSRC